MLNKRLAEIKFKVNQGKLEGYYELIMISRHTEEFPELYSNAHAQKVLETVMHADFTALDWISNQESFNQLF